MPKTSKVPNLSAIGLFRRHILYRSGIVAKFVARFEVVGNAAIEQRDMTIIVHNVGGLYVEVE